jgi:hypothetical protein
VRGSVTVQRDHPRGAVLPRGPGKEPFGGRDVALFAQEKIDGAARFVRGPIQVNPNVS